MGLSGLTPREAARGALTCPKFQNMPDPLDNNLFGPVVVKADVRNILLWFWIINIERVDTLDKIHFIYVRGSIWWRIKSKLWYELGNTMGLMVVSLEEEEEEEKMEEDKEVEQIYQKGKETKRKILTGMSIMSNALIILVQYNTSSLT